MDAPVSVWYGYNSIYCRLHLKSVFKQNTNCDIHHPAMQKKQKKKTFVTYAARKETNVISVDVFAESHLKQRQTHVTCFHYVTFTGRWM